MTVFICGGDNTYERRVLRCWGQCNGQRRRVLISYGSPYYSPIAYCVACGDRWSDGELGERPFRRGWRRQAIAKNRELWAATPPGRVRFDDEFYPIPRPHQVTP
jgi:hypothetical protein